MDFNNIELKGRLTLDPDISESPNGARRVALRIASKVSWIDRSGNTTNDTEYHTVFMFGKLASLVEMSLRKGDQIRVRGFGRIQAFDYISQAGRLVRGVELVANYLDILKSKHKVQLG